MSAHLVELRWMMSRTNERLAVRRNLAALDAERESGCGVERFVDPYEAEVGPQAGSSNQGMEDL